MSASIWNPANSVSPSNPVINVKDYPYLAKGGNADDTAAFLAAFLAASAIGADLIIPQDDYSIGSINVSGSYPRIRIYGNNSIIRPLNASQGQCIYANNSTGPGTFAGVPIDFYDIRFIGRINDTVSDTDANGVADYVVNFVAASTKFFNCSFEYAKVAVCRMMYGQYAEFWSPTIGAAVYSNTTAGILLDSNGVNEASNEVVFYRPKIFSCKNGIVIKGGIKVRIHDPTIQDMRAGGTGGIVIGDDSTTFGADGTLITGVYAEINAIPAVFVGIAPNTTIESGVLLNSTIVSSHCYNISINNVTNYAGGGITLVHPSANTDTASFKISGGNIVADISGVLAHTAGPNRYTINAPAVNDYRRTEDALFAVTYSASMTIDASLGQEARVSVTNNSNFTFNAPTNLRLNQLLSVRVLNTTAGALGTATWNAIFKMLSWTQPNAGFNAVITFRYNGTNLEEVSRVLNVPN